MPESHKERKGRLFRAAVDSLRLESPNAEISDRTGYDKGNVSKIMNGILQPSNKFIQLFEQAFHINIEDFDLKTEKPPEREPYNFEDAVAEKVANRVMEELKPYIARSRDMLLKAIANIQLDMEELHTDQAELKQMQREAKVVLDDSQKSLKVLEERTS